MFAKAGAHLPSGLVPGSTGSVMTEQGVARWALEHNRGTQDSLGGSQGRVMRETGGGQEGALGKVSHFSC